MCETGRCAMVRFAQLRSGSARRLASKIKQASLTMLVWEMRHAFGAPVVPDENKRQMMDSSSSPGDVGRGQSRREADNWMGLQVS